MVLFLVKLHSFPTKKALNFLGHPVLIFWPWSCWWAPCLKISLFIIAPHPAASFLLYLQSGTFVGQLASSAAGWRWRILRLFCGILKRGNCVLAPSIIYLVEVDDDAKQRVYFWKISLACRQQKRLKVRKLYIYYQVNHASQHNCWPMQGQPKQNKAIKIVLWNAAAATANKHLHICTNHHRGWPPPPQCGGRASSLREIFSEQKTIYNLVWIGQLSPVCKIFSGSLR